MNLAITQKFKIPAASLSLFDIIIILVLIPFMDRVVYPLFAKWKIKLSSLRRMGIGMIFAILSVVVAANIEVAMNILIHVIGHMIINQINNIRETEFWIYPSSKPPFACTRREFALLVSGQLLLPCVLKL